MCSDCECRVRVCAHLTGKLQPCSGEGEKQDWGVRDPVYVTSVSVNVVLVKAPVLICVTGYLSVLCVCVCACMRLVLGKYTALAAGWTYQWEHQSLYLLDWNGRNPLGLAGHCI